MAEEVTKAVPETPKEDKPKEGGFLNWLKNFFSGDREGVQDAAADNLAESKETKDAKTLIDVVQNKLGIPGKLEKISPLATEVIAAVDIKNGHEGTYADIDKFFDERLPVVIKALENNEKYKEVTKVFRETGLAAGLEGVSPEALQGAAVAMAKTFFMGKINEALKAKDYNHQIVKLMKDTKFSFKFAEDGSVTLNLPKDFEAQYESVKKGKEAVAVPDMTDEQKIENAKSGFIISGFVGNALKDDYFKEKSGVGDLSTLDDAKRKELEEGWKKDEKEWWTKVVNGQHWTSYIYSFICYVTNGESYPWAQEPYERFRNEMVKQGGFMGKLITSTETLAKPLAASVGKERARGESMKMDSGKALEAWRPLETAEDKSPYYFVDKNPAGQVSSLELDGEFKMPAGSEGQYKAMEVVIPEIAGFVKFPKEMKGIVDSENVEAVSTKTLGRGRYLVRGSLEKGTSFPTGTQMRLLTAEEADQKVKEWKDAKGDKKVEDKKEEKLTEDAKPEADAPAEGTEDAKV